MPILKAARRTVCRHSVLTNIALVVIFWLCYTNVIIFILQHNMNENISGAEDGKITKEKSNSKHIIHRPADKLFENKSNDKMQHHEVSKSASNLMNRQDRDVHNFERPVQKKLAIQEGLKRVKEKLKKKNKVTSPKVEEDKDEKESGQEEVDDDKEEGSTSPIEQSPGLGENGEPVYINEEALSKSERAKYDEGWKNNAFSEYVSTKISLHRSLPDVRFDECKSFEYPSDLPDTSVIVIFHNEAWTVLLRTVHSMLDRSPPDLIREVILVDDCSTFEHLKDQLQDFVDSHPKLRLVRAPKREGLIRARLLGASVAKGKVLTFLDSHCECAEGWLEPLLSRIHENEHNVVCPVIDAIDTKTFEYVYKVDPNSIQVGIFDWKMVFRWMAMPEREKKRRKSHTDPVRSPAMAGGLFSISKAYFERLGSYDRGMDIWGGENLDLSFRIWMCGGVLEIHPCSHVGHIYRTRSPYSYPKGKGTIRKNSIRVAEVWMDEYKKYFYEGIPYNLGDYGNVTERRELRKRLKCHTFKWYLDNIFPELFVPGDALASGEIRNKAEPKCLDSPLKLPKNTDKPELSSYPCHNLGGNQNWMLSQTGEIRRDNSCFDYDGKSIKISKCHGRRGHQYWIYRRDLTIHNPISRSCIQLSLDGKQIEMASCKRTPRQIWMWKRKEPADQDTL